MIIAVGIRIVESKHTNIVVMIVAILLMNVHKAALE